MATIPKTGIVNGQTADASQVTNIIDALDGTTNNEINILGTLSLPNIADVSASIAGISIAGLNQQVQFNNGGAFGASSNFTYNSTSDTLTFGKAVIDEIELPSSYAIKDDGSQIAFNEGQEDYGTLINGFGGTTFINLGDSTLNIQGSTTNINTSAAQSVNIGTGASTTTTIGSSTAGTITITNGGIINLGTSSQIVNLGTNASGVTLGASTSRIQLTSNQIRNSAPAYFYGNSGATALNIGTSTSTTNSANSRAFFTVSSTTAQMGLKSTSNGSGYFNLTAYNTYSEINVQNPTGNSFFINNDKSLSNIQFGGGGTNGRVVVYVSNSSALPNQKPGAAGGAYGGLYVAKNLEIGGEYAWKLSGTTWTVSSDERLKENIVTASLETCYNSVKNIPLKRFNYTENYSETPLHDTNQLGWIAQEVSTELPKAISSGSFTTWTTYTGSEAITGSNGSIVEPGDRVQDTSLGSQTIENFLSLDSDQIIKMMFGAIQHLQAKVEALENQ